METIHLLISILIMILILILFFNYLFYKYYVEKCDNFPLATFIFVISMSIGLLCVLLIPIDVFLSSKDANIESVAKMINLDHSIFQQIMLFLYGASLLSSFLLIPFTYFYAEDKVEFMQSLESAWKSKILNSIKSTFIFLLFCSILLISGLFFRQSDIAYEQLYKNDKLQWVKNVLDTEHFGEKSIAFTVSIFSVFGMLFLILYTGYGLGALPFYLIYGKKSLSSTHEKFELNRAQKRDKIRSLQEKQSRKGQLSSKEKKELNQLKEEEEDMTKKIDKINNAIESEQVIHKILYFLTPFRLLLGVISLMISMLVFASLLITSLDRLLHSDCGVNCGYVVNETNYINYVDYSLRYLSNYFHADYLLFVVINFYVFFCSIYGFVKLSIKIFCITWYDIKRGSTNPQGLLVLSFKLSLMILAFMLEMLTLAPQYATFGTQMISKDGQMVQCSLSHITSKGIKNQCVMTNISMFYNRISVSLPFFSVIFYFANWMLILMIGASISYAMIYRQEEAFDDINYEDDEERQALNDNLYLN